MCMYVCGCVGGCVLFSRGGKNETYINVIRDMKGVTRPYNACAPHSRSLKRTRRAALLRSGSV